MIGADAGTLTDLELEPEVEPEVVLEPAAARFFSTGTSSPLRGDRRWSKDCTAGAYVTPAVGDLSFMGYLIVEGTKVDEGPGEG